MIGKVYGIPPQPPVEDRTHRVAAGAVTLGVEYRALDPESLRATYADNPEHLAELEARSPDGGFTDEGVSLHVWGTDDGHEYVRFDVFDSSGRANPPLLVVVHPSRVARLEGNPSGIRLRNRMATALVLAAAASFWYDFGHGASTRFFPTLIGINLVVVAARLLQLNMSYQHAERVRRQRLAEHEHAARSQQPEARS